MQGTFYVVGVGPGDPQLMTLKAAAILKRCDVWFVPSAFDNGGSMALKIAAGAVDRQGKTILSHRFPMKQVHRGHAVLVERCSLADQKIWADVRQAVDREIHYFSTMVVRKP